MNSSTIFTRKRAAFWWWNECRRHQPYPGLTRPKTQFCVEYHIPSGRLGARIYLGPLTFHTRAFKTDSGPDLGSIRPCRRCDSYAPDFGPAGKSRQYALPPSAPTSSCHVRLAAASCGCPTRRPLNAGNAAAPFALKACSRPWMASSRAPNIHDKGRSADQLFPNQYIG